MGTIVENGNNSSIPTTLTVNNNSNNTFNGTIQNGTIQSGGSLSLLKTGSALLTLGGSNTYSGGTTLSAGGLALAASAALGGPLTINGGTLQAAASLSAPNAINVGGPFAVGGSNNLLLSGGVNLGGASQAVTVNNTASTIFTGVLSNGGLVKSGPGTLSLTNSGNSYAAGTTVNQGTLQAANPTALGSGSVLLQNGKLSLTAESGIGGFGGMQMNNGATLANNVLTLTDGGGNEARSAFTSSLVPINNATGFTANFVYTAGGNKGADGATFTIQSGPARRPSAAAAAVWVTSASTTAAPWPSISIPSLKDRELRSAILIRAEPITPAAAHRSEHPT